MNEGTTLHGRIIELAPVDKYGRCEECGAVPTRETGRCKCVVGRMTVVALTRREPIDVKRAWWIEGWMQGAGQMVTWSPEALHSEAERQWKRRAALAATPTEEEGT